MNRKGKLLTTYAAAAAAAAVPLFSLTMGAAVMATLWCRGKAIPAAAVAAAGGDGVAPSYVRPPWIL